MYIPCGVNCNEERLAMQLVTGNLSVDSRALLWSPRRKHSSPESSSSQPDQLHVDAQAMSGSAHVLAGSVWSEERNLGRTDMCNQMLCCTVGALHLICALHLSRQALAAPCGPLLADAATPAALQVAAPHQRCISAN